MKTEIWSLQADEVLAGFSITAPGLSSTGAEKRLGTDGKDRLTKGNGDSVLRVFLRQLESPATLLLLPATAIPLLIQDTMDALITFAIVLFSAALSLSQGYHAGVAVEEPLKMISDKVAVCKDGREQGVSTEDLAHGDVIVLRVGDLIPVDCYLLSVSSLTADENALIGKTFPAEKCVGTPDAGTVFVRRSNYLYMGTGIKADSGWAVVVHTAPGSKFGKILKSV